MFRSIKYILIIVIIFCLILIINFWQGIYRPFGSAESKMNFAIAAGENVKTIAADLESRGLIKSKWHFIFYVWLIKKQSDLKAGEYELSPSLSAKSIAGILITGQTENRERVITIPEGWNIKEIENYLVKENITVENDFTEAAKRPANSWVQAYRPAGENNFLTALPPASSLEGILFPDTYRIYKDAGADEIIVKMLENFDKKVIASVGQEIDRQNKELFAVVTLASIIEKEVAAANDRKIVSGIFWKRLAAGMPLQADSTVNYLTGNNTPAISLSDRDIDSPYNTYKYPGLPPGPICSPGLDSVLAAVYPEVSEYWYFLNRLDNGQTIFSRTYDEHLANKAKFLK